MWEREREKKKTNKETTGKNEQSKVHKFIVRTKEMRSRKKLGGKEKTGMNEAPMPNKKPLKITLKKVKQQFLFAQK